MVAPSSSSWVRLGRVVSASVKDRTMGGTKPGVVPDADMVM